MGILVVGRMVCGRGIFEASREASEEGFRRRQFDGMAMVDPEGCGLPAHGWTRQLSATDVHGEEWASIVVRSGNRGQQGSGMGARLPRTLFSRFDTEATHRAVLLAHPDEGHSHFLPELPELSIDRAETPVAGAPASGAATAHGYDRH
jgi:hypothetical protein